MLLFHIIDDGVAILRINGKRYRQCKVYRRGAEVYAQLGAEFVRLLSHGGTTDPRISCQGVEGSGIIAGGTKAPVWAP